ncbi:MAG: hypothetical protein DRO76_03255 [Candidatus Altiarchaeales archaeon]|nr:MAG: hypothetical protein DRO76_03255 [Candidatus Altiarchaeales archaeon]HDI73362.1 hypothetical protein [Candidatus Altiarchaeales archaeon]
MKSIFLSSEELQRLMNYVKRNGLREIKVKSRYEIFRIDDKERDVGIIAYKTGMVVHNDTDSSRSIIRKIIEVERGYDYVLGTDEAGKGEWYGPLVVECVALTPDDMKGFREMGIRDSKKIDKRSLLEMGKELTRLKFIRRPLILMPEIYNKKYEEFKKEGKTLNDMLAWAHSRAIKDLLSELEFENAKVIIDKFDVKKIEFRLGDLKRENVEIIQKTKAETEIPVAAASVLAKFIFEKEVDGLNEKFGINLRKAKPEKIPAEILPKVAKLHFKNVRGIS